MHAVLTLALTIALISDNAFGDTRHYRELVDVCLRIQHPTATQAYCTCTADRFMPAPEREQLLLIELAQIAARTPEPNPQQAQQMQAELRAHHQGEPGFDALDGLPGVHSARYSGEVKTRRHKAK